MNRLNGFTSYVPWPPRCPFEPRTPVCDGPVEPGSPGVPLFPVGPTLPLSPLKSSPEGQRKKEGMTGMFLIWHYQKLLTAQKNLDISPRYPISPLSPFRPSSPWSPGGPGGPESKKIYILV